MAVFFAESLVGSFSAMAFIATLLICTSLLGRVYSSENRFPSNFQIGVGSAAYQIEGGWNASDKGESIWDHLTHIKPSKIYDGSTGDIVCDSYNRYMEDIEMLADLGVDFYRFSLSWPRILPTGFKYKISTDGIAYYNNVINELLKRNITPLVTIYHWDLPQTIQNLGGWTNRKIVDYFEDYARVVFDHFGDRVKNWTSINEPVLICHSALGTSDNYAPDWSLPGIADYMCNHNLQLAHARVWHVYDAEYRPTQRGRMGITFYSPWIEPETNSAEDKAIAERALEFSMGWQANAIFSKQGDYPEIIKSAILNRSLEQNFNESRLPSFTKEEIEYVRGTYDFFGLNFYTSEMTGATRKLPKSNDMSKGNDMGYSLHKNESWPRAQASWFRVNAPGLRKLLNWIRLKYDNPELLITENGYPTGEGLEDINRVNYINQHMKEMLNAIEDGCNITAYTAWTLMDNFEWVDGYTVRFGLYEVDFNAKNRTRTPRMSALVYKQMVKTRKIDFGYMPHVNITKVSSSSGRKTVTNIENIFITMIVILIANII